MATAIRFYLDEHVQITIAAELRRRNVDVLTVFESELAGASDEMLIELASRLGRVIFTQDKDFLRLHRAGVPHHGIAYAPQRLSVGDIVRGLMLIYEVLSDEEMPNHLEYL